MSKNKTVLFCFFLLVFVFTSSVSGVEPVEPESYGAQMVEAGMKLFANSIGDSMISLGTGNSTVDRTETPGLIFRMITYG